MNAIVHLVNQSGTSHDALLADLDGDGTVDGQVDGHETRQVDGEATYFFTVDDGYDGFEPSPSSSGGITSTTGENGWPENTILLDNGYRLVATGDNAELKIYEPTEAPYSDAGTPFLTIKGDPHVYLNGEHLADFTQDSTLMLDGYAIELDTTSQTGVSYLQAATVTAPNGETASIFGIDSSQPSTTNVGRPPSSASTAPTFEGMDIEEIIFTLFAYVIQEFRRLIEEQANLIADAEIENNDGVAIGRGPNGEEFNIDLEMQRLNRMVNSLSQLETLFLSAMNDLADLTDRVAQA